MDLLYSNETILDYFKQPSSSCALCQNVLSPFNSPTELHEIGELFVSVHDNSIPTSNLDEIGSNKSPQKGVVGIDRNARSPRGKLALSRDA
ncbi:hypothetical protein Ae201684_007394 [Aphanomyces euteiches]|uniref:Uncharacterized protein n=1 Tax=Aphanomyces euteiches TaxID=100861 RepID=A0A6G0X8H1_9STRA|nr:hypothetical protein Ae201684_007394 [Aphanomyces euteiches]